MAAADSYRAELVNKLCYMKQAVIETPRQGLDLSEKPEGFTKRLNAVNRQMNGDVPYTLVCRNGKVSFKVYC